ncbi:hypothetical protein EYC84_005977 [Monilinia fructicola]|uniref:Uncharacterized protein n=1 Tax=Monilinia fructicola TaxID=38448 RepID=A0A5M9K176_MONFR|nr:hypothetical protein EYC84_005977 [Monilinia fructicola]
MHPPSSHMRFAIGTLGLSLRITCRYFRIILLLRLRGRAGRYDFRFVERGGRNKMLDDGAVDCVFKGGGAAGRRSRFRDEGFEDGILAIEGLVIVHPQVCCFSAAGKSVYAYDDCSIPRFRLGVFIEVGTSKCILTRLFNQFSVDRPFQNINGK